MKIGTNSFQNMFQIKYNDIELSQAVVDGILRQYRDAYATVFPYFLWGMQGGNSIGFFGQKNGSTIGLKDGCHLKRVKLIPKSDRKWPELH